MDKKGRYRIIEYVYKIKYTSNNNKLYINTTSNMIEGNTQGVDYKGTGYYYKLTEVRKNIGQTY